MKLSSKLGDTKTFRIPLRWGNAAFSPAANYDLTFTLKSDEDDSDSAAIIQKATGGLGIVIDESFAVLSILRSDTYREADFPDPGDPAYEATAGTYYWDIQADGLGDFEGDCKTVASGTYSISRDITRATGPSVPIYTTDPPHTSSVTNATVNAAIAVDPEATREALEIPIDNFSAITTPTINDDSSDGYSAGSKWYDTVGQEAYLCVDASVGAAVWILATLTADDLGSAAFTASTDYATAAQGALADSALQPSDLSAPPAIGDGTPNSGAFTTLSATGTATLPHIHGSLAGNLYIHVRNTTGGVLSRGTPIYIVGNVGDTDRVTVAAADNTNAAKMPAVGLLEESLNNNGDGNAIIVGELPAANTNSYSINQELYVGVGAITGTKPTTGEVQSIGTVARVQTNTGVIVVNMQGRRTRDGAFATAAQGALADSAVQPGDLATVATTGAYADLSGTPDLSGYATTTELADYLPLAGGTMSGTLNVPTIQNLLNTDLVIDAYNDDGVGTHNYFKFNPYGGSFEMPANSAGIIFENASAIREAGEQGLEIECSVGYRWQWVAGRMILRMVNSGQIARILAIDGVTPTSTDDDTNGFVIGTRWETVDGTIYICTDATEDAAVWRRGYSGNSSVTTWHYRAETGIITGDPTSGRLIWNNATQVFATSINVSHKDQDGDDIEFFLGFLQEGQQLFLQDRDVSQNFQIWSVSGTPTLTDGGTANAYFTFPVTLVDSGGTGTTGFADNHQLLFGTTQALALHAPTHAIGGSDPLTPADIGALPLAGGTMDAGADINFANGSRLREGLTDAGNGGAGGIAMVCSLDYEFKWEAGRLYVMGQDGFTIRTEMFGFTTAPTTTDDAAKGYIIGSRRILDDGTVYVCTNATTSSAVWVYQGIRDIAGVASINQDTRKLIASDGATEMLDWSSSTAGIAIPVGMPLGVDLIFDADSPSRYIDVVNGELGDYTYPSTYTSSIDWANRDLYHSDGSYSLSWQLRKLYDSAGVEALDWSGTYAGVYIDRAGGAGAVIYSTSGTGVDASSGSSWGAYIQSNSGTGAEIFSDSGVGASISSDSGRGANISSNSNTGAKIYSDSGRGASIDTNSGSVAADIYNGGSGRGAYIYSVSGEGARIETVSGSVAADIYNNGSGDGAYIYSASGDHLNVGAGLLVVANNGDTTLTGLLIAKAVTVTPNTVAALTGGEGTIAYVNNATTPVIGVAVAGGGSAKCLVCYNGTSWIVTSLL